VRKESVPSSPKITNGTSEMLFAHVNFDAISIADVDATLIPNTVIVLLGLQRGIGRHGYADPPALLNSTPLGESF
jgi:hypothetical protein